MAELAVAGGIGAVLLLAVTALARTASDGAAAIQGQATVEEQLRRSINGLTNDLRGSTHARIAIDVLADGSHQVTLTSVVGHLGGQTIWGASPLPIGRLADNAEVMRGAEPSQVAPIATASQVVDGLSNAVSGVLGLGVGAAAAVAPTLGGSGLPTSSGAARTAAVSNGLLNSNPNSNGGMSQLTAAAAPDGSVVFDVAPADAAQIEAKMAANGYDILSFSDWEDADAVVWRTFVVAPTGTVFPPGSEPAGAAPPLELGGLLASAVSSLGNLTSEALDRLLTAADEILPSRVVGIPSWSVRYTVLGSGDQRGLYRQLLDDAGRLVRSELLLERVAPGGVQASRVGRCIELVLTVDGGRKSERRSTLVHMRN